MHQPMADVLPTNGGVAGEHIGDEYSLDKAINQYQPQQAITCPGTGTNNDNSFVCADGNRCDNGGGTKNCQKS